MFSKLHLVHQRHRSTHDIVLTCQPRRHHDVASIDSTSCVGIIVTTFRCEVTLVKHAHGCFSLDDQGGDPCNRVVVVVQAICHYGVGGYKVAAFSDGIAEGRVVMEP